MCDVVSLLFSRETICFILTLPEDVSHDTYGSLGVNSEAGKLVL
jgi:hypothetical protein